MQYSLARIFYETVTGCETYHSKHSVLPGEVYFILMVLFVAHEIYGLVSSCSVDKSFGID